MSNYKDIEPEFIERTLALISQYEIILHRYPFEEQYNHTLLINCLLGLVVMPKELTLKHIPKEKLLRRLREEMGLVKSEIKFKYRGSSISNLFVEKLHSTF